MSLRFTKSLMRVLVLLTLFMLLGCGQAPLSSQPPQSTSGPSTVTNDPLNNTKWFLQSLDGRAPLQETTITLVFSKGFAGGESGCNNYFGGGPTRNYTISENGGLKIQFVHTARPCPSPEGVMEQEAAYFEALSRVAGYNLAEDRLELKDGTGETILVFTR